MRSMSSLSSQLLEEGCSFPRRKGKKATEKREKKKVGLFPGHKLFCVLDVTRVDTKCAGGLLLFSAAKTRKRADATKPAFNKKMQVVLEEGCGASCGTGLRGKSGEYIFTTSFITIGFDPFDDVFFSSKLTSSTVCTVFPRGNSLVVWNDVFDVIKVNGVILKNSEEICTSEHSSVVIETGSLSQHPLKVTVHPFTPSDVADKMHDTKLTAILDDGTGPNHCNGPAFLTCVNPSHNCNCCLPRWSVVSSRIQSGIFRIRCLQPF